MVYEAHDFCRGYRDGKEDAWREILQVEGDQVLGEASDKTLAEIMNDLRIHRHRLGRVTVRPS
jgi:hypothetical protein